MNNYYSELISSFIRRTSLPLEADYLFSSEKELFDYYSNIANKNTLHKGLLRAVLSDKESAIYWVDNNLELVKLIDGNTLDGISNIEKEIKDILTKLLNITKLIEGLNTKTNEIIKSSGFNEDGKLKQFNTSNYLKQYDNYYDMLLRIDSELKELYAKNMIGTKDSKTVELIKQQLNDDSIVLKADVIVQPNKDIIITNEGISSDISLKYENGHLKLLSNNNLKNSIPMSINSILENAYYDTQTEEIVMDFKLDNGTIESIRIDVGKLIRVLSIDNAKGEAITLFLEDNIGDQNYLSAKVNINNTKEDNLVVVKDNGLYVSLDYIKNNIEFETLTWEIF